MQSKQVRLIKKYLSTNSRVQKYLAKIVELFQKKPEHTALNIFLKKSLKSLIAFKSLILIHVLIHEQAADRTLCSNVLRGMTFCMDKDFDVVISQKYLNPYRLFLQKRCQIDLKAQPQSEVQRLLSVFQLLNLIKVSSSFQQIIYIFARYFAEKHKFIIDFNIVLAKDITKVYTTLQKKMPSPYSQEMLKQIQLVHQVMYPIYFNNYFFQYLRAFRPRWTNTEEAEEVIRPQKAVQKLKKSKIQIPTEPSTNQKKQNQQQVPRMVMVQTNKKKYEYKRQSTTAQSNQRQDSIDATSQNMSEPEDPYIVNPFAEQLQDCFSNEQLLLVQPSPQEIHSFFQQ